jgi:tetratricopeptide (TPR) repeat protein
MSESAVSKDEPRMPEDEVFSLRRSKRQRVLVWAFGAPLSLALTGGAVAFVAYVNPPAVSTAFAAAVFMAALGLGLAWALVNASAVVVLTPAHVIHRPPMRRPTAIAWAEVATVKNRQSKGLRIISSLGERIDIAAEFANDALWAGLRRYLPTEFHGQLLGLPGFEQLAAPSRAKRAMSLLIGLAMGVTWLAVGKVDWSTPEVRCIRETAASLLGPKLSCLERAAAAHDVEWMKSLLGKGANPDRANKQGNTALHSAVGRNFPDGVRLLLQSGADLFRENKKGDTALDLAIAAKDYESLTVMLKHIRAQGSRDVAQSILQMAVLENDTTFRALVKTELGALLPRVADPTVQKKYESLLNGAVAAFDKRDFGASIALANEAIELDPDIGPAYYVSGIGYGEMKNWGQSKARIRKALELMPDNVDVLRYQGNLFYMTGEFEQAEDSFTRAIKRHPNAWAIYVDRALNRADAGRIQAALEDAALACRQGAPSGCEVEGSLRRQLAH